MKIFNQMLLLLTLLVGSATVAHAQCTASFQYTANGNAVTFSASTTGTSNPIYFWQFDDYANNSTQSATTTTPNYVHTYSGNSPLGYHYACLTVFDSLTGCQTTTFCDTIWTSAPNPCAGFSASFAYTTNGNTAIFTPQVNNGTSPYFYQWQFGDGGFSTQANPSHTYNSPGQYGVILIAQDTNGCIFTFYDSVSVGNSNPCANAAAGFQYTSNGTVTTFNSTASGFPSGNYLYYTWTFYDYANNNTQTITTTNPAYTYNFSGTPALGYHYACLTVYDSISGCQAAYCDTIWAGGANPCAGFAASYAFVPDSASTNSGYFYSTITGGTAPYQYIWTINNSTVAGANPYWQFATAGTYVACLSVTDANGCLATFCDSVVVGNGSGSPCNLNEVSLGLTLDNFPFETTWDVTDANGNVLYSGSNYGSNMNGMTINEDFCLPTGCYTFNIYDSYGDGICCLYGQGQYSLTDGATGALITSGGAFNYQDSYTFCVGGATNPCSGYSAVFADSVVGTTAHFTGTVSGATGSATWIWDFGDGTTATNTGANNTATHTYTTTPASGYYVVCLTVVDNNCTATYCDSVAVAPQPCTNNAITLTLNLDNFAYETSWDLTDANGNVVHSGGNYTQNGGTITQNFCLPTGCYDFNIYDSYGDGICCAWGQGSYQLTDANGNALVSGGAFNHVESTNFCVGGATNPCGNFNAQFAYNVDPNGLVTFTPQVNGGTAPYSYNWQFNNGSSTQNSPTHNYGGNGYYFACLVVTDNNGCAYTVCDTVMVTNNNTNPCANVTMNVNMAQDSTNPFLIWMQPVINNAAPNSQFTFAWSFGDGSGVSTGYPAHQYTNYGSYVVCVIAVDSINGCALTFCDTINIDSSGNFSRMPDYKDVKPGFMVNTMPAVINYNTSITQVANGTATRLFPNPANTAINVAFESKANETVAISVLNMQGKVVLQTTEDIHAGENQLTFDINELPAAAYMIRLTGASTQATAKFVKQ